MRLDHQSDRQKAADKPDRGQASSTELKLELSPRMIARTFGFTVAMLLIMHSVVQIVRFTTGDDRVYGLVYMFSVGADGNIPTFYSAFALLFSSFLLAFTGLLTNKAGKPMVAYWVGLSLIFAFLSADEMLELHEKLIEPLRELLDASGAFYYAWIIPYAIAVLVIFIVYLRFLASLPRRTAIGFILAGGIFVAGAIGLEMFGGVLFESYGGKHPAYVAGQTIEEALEMIGIVIFIYAIADYVGKTFGSVTISFNGS